MFPSVTLTVTNGSQAGREFVFDDPGVYTIGRSSDCDVRLPSGLEYLDISRHHCVLEIDPPGARIQDLGSRNGTYVNGVKIGQRKDPWTVGDYCAVERPEYDLEDGDEIRVGHVLLRVNVASPALVASPQRSDAG